MTYALWCGKCKQLCPAEDFPVQRGRSNDKFPGYCKNCRRLYQEAYRKDHPRNLDKEYQQQQARLKDWKTR